MANVRLCSDCAEARKSVESVKCLPAGILLAQAEGFKGHRQFQVHLPTVFSSLDFPLSFLSTLLGFIFIGVSSTMIF